MPYPSAVLPPRGNSVPVPLFPSAGLPDFRTTKGSCVLVRWPADAARLVAVDGVEPRPVFVAYGCATSTERAAALRAGADHALEAPPGPCELAACMEATQRARRYGTERLAAASVPGGASSSLPAPAAPPLAIAYEPATRRLRGPLGEVVLSPNPGRLVEVLLAHPGAFVPVPVLYREVWRLDFVPATNRLNETVSRLRRGLTEVAPGVDVLVKPRGGFSLGERDPAKPRVSRTGLSLALGVLGAWALDVGSFVGAFVGAC